MRRKTNKYFTEYYLQRYHQITIFEAIEQLEKSRGGGELDEKQSNNEFSAICVISGNKSEIAK